MLLEEAIEERATKLKEELNLLNKAKRRLAAVSTGVDFVSTSSTGITLWAHDYPKLLKIFTQIRKALGVGHTLKFQYSSGRSIHFKYDFGDTKIEVNFECDVDHVPPQLLGECRLELKESRTTDYVMVCDS